MRRVAFTQEARYFVCRKRRPRWSVLMFLVVFCLRGQHHLGRDFLDATVFLLFCLFPQTNELIMDKYSSFAFWNCFWSSSITRYFLSLFPSFAFVHFLDFQPVLMLWIPKWDVSALYVFIALYANAALFSHMHLGTAVLKKKKVPRAFLGLECHSIEFKGCSALWRIRPGFVD